MERQKERHLYDRFRRRLCPYVSPSPSQHGVDLAKRLGQVWHQRLSLATNICLLWMTRVELSITGISIYDRKKTNFLQVGGKNSGVGIDQYQNAIYSV
jgi:hypothetical protein